MVSPVVVRLGALVIIVSVALVATAVLGVLHVITNFALDLELGDCHGEDGVKCLLCVGLHIKLRIDHLTLVHSKRLRQQQSCLVPVRGRMLGTRVENAIVVVATEDGVEVYCIAVKDSCLVHFVLELKVHRLEVSQCAILKVKGFSEGFIRKIFAGIISVQNRLRKLL